MTGPIVIGGEVNDHTAYQTLFKWALRKFCWFVPPREVDTSGWNSHLQVPAIGEDICGEDGCWSTIFTPENAPRLWASRQKPVSFGGNFLWVYPEKNDQGRALYHATWKGPHFGGYVKFDSSSYASAAKYFDHRFYYGENGTGILLDTAEYKEDCLVLSAYTLIETEIPEGETEEKVTIVPRALVTYESLYPNIELIEYRLNEDTGELEWGMVYAFTIPNGLGICSVPSIKPDGSSAVYISLHRVGAAPNPQWFKETILYLDTGIVGGGFTEIDRDDVSTLSGNYTYSSDKDGLLGWVGDRAPSGAVYNEGAQVGAGDESCDENEDEPWPVGDETKVWTGSASPNRIELLGTGYTREGHSFKVFAQGLGSHTRWSSFDFGPYDGTAKSCELDFGGSNSINMPVDVWYEVNGVRTDIDNYLSDFDNYTDSTAKTTFTNLEKMDIEQLTFPCRKRWGWSLCNYSISTSSGGTTTRQRARLYHVNPHATMVVYDRYMTLNGTYTATMNATGKGTFCEWLLRSDAQHNDSESQSSGAGKKTLIHAGSIFRFEEYENHWASSSGGSPYISYYDECGTIPEEETRLRIKDEPRRGALLYTPKVYSEPASWTWNYPGQTLPDSHLSGSFVLEDLYGNTICSIGLRTTAESNEPPLRQFIANHALLQSNTDIEKVFVEYNEDDTIKNHPVTKDQDYWYGYV